MTKITLPYDLANKTPADAVPPETNFNRIEQHINQELIERDGTVAMRAQLRLVGDPVNVLDAAAKQYVDALGARFGAQVTFQVGQALPFSPGPPVTLNIVTVPSEYGGDWWTAGNTLIVPGGGGGLYVVLATIGSTTGGASAFPAVNGSISPPTLGNTVILNAGDAVTFSALDSINPPGTVTANSGASLYRVSA